MLQLHLSDRQWVSLRDAMIHQSHISPSAIKNEVKRQQSANQVNLIMKKKNNEDKKYVEPMLISIAYE